MTLRYRLLGKPGNIGEFVDKARKLGTREVGIEVRHRRESICGGASFQHYPLYLNAGASKIAISGDATTNVLGNTHEDEVRNLVAQHNSFVEATRVGSYLEREGFNVSVQGVSLSKSGILIDEHRERAETTARGYELDLTDPSAPQFWKLQ